MKGLRRAGVSLHLVKNTGGPVFQMWGYSFVEKICFTAFNRVMSSLGVPLSSLYTVT